MRWVKAFRGGRMSTADMPCSGHSVSIHIGISVTMIEQCMEEYRHWTVKALAERMEITGSTLLQLLDICKIAAKWV